MSENCTEGNDFMSVNVAVRIRPQSAKEKLSMNQVCTSVAPNSPQIFLGKDTSFTFDFVFNMHSHQEQIFNTLSKPLIDSCMDGYNATILAYGQTGSGKTYTMGTGFELGVTGSHAGIVPRAVEYLFSSISDRRAKAAANGEPVPEFKVVAQFLELYNEELVDLLDADRSRKSHLRLHENAEGDIYLTGVSTRLVSGLEDTMKCLRDGSLIRSTASTNMNAQSSRSHAIFTLHIRQQRLLKYEDVNGNKAESQSDTDADPDSTTADRVPEFETLTAKFHFVDLAGSERLKRTGATGDRAKEGISINRGLLALGNVISALGDKTKRGCHVPYRDSKLTRLLQDSLGGNSRTIMIACISPSDCDFIETLNTLKYANRARNIRNRLVLNQDKTSKQLSLLRTQLASLQEELDEYRQGKRGATAEGMSDISQELAILRSDNDKLRLRIKALTVTVDTLKSRNAYLLALQGTHKMSAGGQPSSGGDEAPGDEHIVNGGDGEEGQSVQQLVEKYTLEIETLRSRVVEAEALAEFSRRPFAQASPLQSDGLGGGVRTGSTRVAVTSGEFPDLDSSTLCAAEAGLSAVGFYLDDDDDDDDDNEGDGIEVDMDPDTTLLESTLTSELGRQQQHRGRHNKKKKRKRRNASVDEEQATFTKLAGGEKWADSKRKPAAAGECVGPGSHGDETNDSVMSIKFGDEGSSNTCVVSVEDDPANDGDVNSTLLASPLDSKMRDVGEVRSRSADDPTLSDASDLDSDASDSEDDDDDLGTSSDASSIRSRSTEDRRGTSASQPRYLAVPAIASKAGEPGLSEDEARLHQSLAHISSEIDIKRRLLTELQAKASQLARVKQHYERQLANLQTRIRETERERDTVMANLGQVEHISEERLRKTRQEFEKKLSALQDEVRQLQTFRQEQQRFERLQAKKNDQLRMLRSELEELRRYKLDLTKRLREETKRTRLVEAVSAKRMMELRKAKSQADSQIRSLEAAHTAKERALQQKQAEVEVLKRKAMEQQRQFSSHSTTTGGGGGSSASAVLPNRMTRSFVATLPSNSAVGRRPAPGGGRPAHASGMSMSLYAGSVSGSAIATPSGYHHPVPGLPNRVVLGAKNKWVLLSRELAAEAQRRQTSARLEHDLQTWLRERDSLGRRLQRLQRRRTRVEEAGEDEPEAEIGGTGSRLTLAAFDEQIRNVTAQLESVQEAIRECQASIIELDKTAVTCAPGPTGRPGLRNRLLPGGGGSSAAPASLQVLTSCSMAESRFLLLRLFECAVTDRLAAMRSQQLEAQLQATLSMREQEREQELEMLRLALQHAGVPIESLAPQQNLQQQQQACRTHHTVGCECCSLVGGAGGAMSSAVPTSDESSDEAEVVVLETGEGHLHHQPYSAIMTQSMQAMLQPTSVPRGVSRTASETDSGAASTRAADLVVGQTVKARLRTLQPEEMLGLDPIPTAADDQLMPPPASGVRRPRTLPSFGSDAVVGETSSLTCSPLPCRRLVGVSRNLHMTTSLTSQVGTSDTAEGDLAPSSPNQQESGGVGTAADAVDVFNRLTSGMSSSPNPSKGSIQPMSRNPSCQTTTNSLLSVQQRVSPVNGLDGGGNFVISSSSCYSASSATTTSAHPLAAFFSGASAAAPASVVSVPPPPVQQQQATSFRVPMECTHVARGHSTAVLDVDISGSLMVTGSKDRTGKIWDLQTMEEVATLGDHPNNVSKVRICPVNSLVFTVCSYFIKLWDLRDPRRCIRTLLSSGLNQDGILETSVIRRQNICPPGETNIMDIALGGPHPGLAHCMFLATANSVKVWDLRRYYSVGKLHGNHQAPVMVLAAGQQTACGGSSQVNGGVSDAQLTVVTGSKDHYIKVFNVGANSTGLLTPTFDLEPPHYDGIESLALHGSTLFSGSRDAAIKKWNLARGGRQEVMLAQAHKDWIQGLVVTTDGSSLISGCRGGHLKLWNASNCICLGEVLNAHDGSINAIRTVGNRVFTAGSDKDIRFWRLLDDAASR